MSYNKSIQAFIDRQKKALAAFENDATSPLRIAAYDTHAKMNERIFEDGLNAKGSLIGKYNDTKPIYVNPEKFAGKKFPVGGKSEAVYSIKTKKASKKKSNNKTRFFSSYKDFKQVVTGKSDKVNFILVDELRRDFANGEVTPSPEKVNNYRYVAQVKKDINVKKIEGLTEKYGDVFKLTKSERENFKDVQEFELNRLLGK